MEEVDGPHTVWHPVWLDTPRVFVDRREEEAETFNDLLAQHLMCVETWTCDNLGWTFRLSEAVITIVNDQAEPPRATVTSDTIPRRFLDGMRIELRSMLQDSYRTDWSPIGFAITLLQMVEEAVSWQLLLKSQLGWESCQAQAWDDPNIGISTFIFGNPQGVNLLSSGDAAHHLLGESVADICCQISDDYRIIHVEPVFRRDLVSRFLQRK